MREILYAIGLVLVVEGLVLALAPLRLDRVIRLWADIPAGRRRAIGLVALAVGVALVYLARG